MAKKIKIRQEWTYCGWWSLSALQTEFEVKWPTHPKFRSCAVSFSYHHCGTVVFSDILCQPQWEKMLMFEMSFSTPACENFFPWQFWIFLFLCFHWVILMHKWKTHHQSPLMETVQFPLADSQRSSPSQVQVLYFHLKSRNPSKFRSPDLRCSILARPSPSSVISA